MKTTSPEPIFYSVPGVTLTIPVYTGNNLFNNIKSIFSFDTFSSVLVITDENVNKHWGKQIREVLGNTTTYLVIKAGEKNKNLAAVEKIWTTLSQNRFDRRSLVINIGGGMVCDIGAFAASTFMRGIPFAHVPTTLLAQADAAIGGKTGFNFNGLKNTIGTFASPLTIISDTAFLTTLPQREYNSGFAEIIKHAIIADAQLFADLGKKKLTNLKDKELDKILSQSTQIKCDIVKKDPYEKSDRKKLNFGHTVGHAVEMACKNKLLHGEAIAIGMIAEARMSFISGNISAKKFGEIENLISKAFLPNKISTIHKKLIFEKMHFDKKNVGHQIKWVFLEDIGKVKVDVVLPNEIINEGLNYILK